MGRFDSRGEFRSGLVRPTRRRPDDLEPRRGFGHGRDDESRGEGAKRSCVCNRYSRPRRRGRKGGSVGGHPYWYIVKHQPDLNAVLQSLRQREFKAGRYNPAIDFPDFPVDASSRGPGAQHASIEDAQEDADADGTRSILDIESVGDEPDFGVACPLAPDVLVDLYGTDQPSRAAVEANLEFLEEVERGQAVYVVLYKDGKPDEVLFAGYSYD